MKKIVCSVLILMCFVLSGCNNNKPAEQKITEVSDIESLAAQIGFDISVPEQARNIECFIINNLIAQTDFTYEGVMYTHKASKTFSDVDLHGLQDTLTEEDTFELEDKTSGTVYSVESGGRVAIWYFKGTHHALYSAKTVGTDTIKEIVNKV